MKPMNTELATRQVIDDLERVMDELKNIPAYRIPSDAPLEDLESEMDRIVELYQPIVFIQNGLRDGSVVIIGVPREGKNTDESKTALP